MLFRFIRLRRFAAFTSSLLVSAALTQNLLAQTTLHVPADQSTIQAAIDAASTGDTVLVSPGTYYENLTVSGKELTFTSTNGAAQTVLDGSFKGSVLTIRNTPTLRTTVSGFTFQHGIESTSGLGAGVSLLNAGATIRDNLFQFNNLAAAVNNSAAAFNGNTVSSVVAGTLCPAFGGVNVSGGSLPAVLDANGNPAATTIDGNTFNGPGTATCAGSGVYVVPGPAVFIQNNTFTGFSVGVNLTPGQTTLSKPVVIRQNILRGNATGGVILGHAPGAVFNQPPADTFVINNTFSDNLGFAVAGLHQAEIATFGPASRLVIVNNIVSTHSSVGVTLYCGGDPPSAANPATLPVISNNIGWNPLGSTVSGSCTVSGLINTDPEFVSSSNLHLANSVGNAVDGGNNGAPYLPGADLTETPASSLFEGATDPPPS